MSNQRKILHDDRNGLDYVLVGDYYLPVLSLPEETRPIGYWGMLRKEYLKKHKKISEFDSENLMYSLIEEIIADNKYSFLEVVCHFPLSTLIRDTQLLNEQEDRYVKNLSTHLDFLIYNRISKKPVLAVEVDGYEYHKNGTKQNQRDLMKNHIMEVYGIPLLRFKTNGSGEREKITEMLEKQL